MPRKEKYIKSDKYRGVFCFKSLGKFTTWKAMGSANGRKFTIMAESERDAALKFDKKRIELGKEPVNILKRKEDVPMK